MTTTVLEFDSVAKAYGKQVVLSKVDLVVDEGEFFGLVGVNGVGKTTLIKSMLDFCSIDGGAIEIFGRSHRDTRARSRLAFLPERFIPPYFLTGGDFLLYMCKLHAVTYDPDRVEQMLSALDLDRTALAKPVRQLSKGMAQKLGLVACLLSGKELFVLDEPMSGLDPKARAQFKQLLLDLKAARHTVFFSTHLLSDVETLCARMAILHDGEIRFVGSPQECCSQYDVEGLERAYLACVSGKRKTH
ncbi:MAG: ABC transporter ATP-binding protein [Gammaproteobacteria bacterium]|nr:ABC transporter ATP-binding protein [Gammaproteobacteria bacterium]MCI0590388.1 ABC transporter ATP-binding protein [Gammaproteobacteria bacterium]